jgi:hypothetical protein
MQGFRLCSSSSTKITSAKLSPPDITIELARDDPVANEKELDIEPA